MLQPDGRVTADQTFNRRDAEEWFFKKVSLLNTYGDQLLLTPRDRFNHFMNGTTWAMRCERVREYIKAHDLQQRGLGKNSEGNPESVNQVFLRLYGEDVNSKPKKETRK